jgi:hypothetical protein
MFIYIPKCRIIPSYAKFSDQEPNKNKKNPLKALGDARIFLLATKHIRP